MKCNWCRNGSGRNYTKDKNGKIYYYYCQDCIGQIAIELTPKEKINQEKLDKTWGLFIKATTNLNNKQKNKFIQLRDKLQKEINEKGYANINDPKLKEWWLND